ncbi:hypothetical protein [Microbacterium sp. C7(2022)]|uniref:hypothetical protein n=1 Tax=Microbacterium sp. C7(2022) TaxID=2992759 RepID=UPI00237A6232|nr:hypothetical protein [Microbacterium sp. C7(2022)]MDE0545194.1 hypothetical protein [Microbacterium sp. C7(2022)]
MTDQPSRRRHSPAVYRRRRLVVLLAIIAIGASIWLLIAQPWQGSAADNTTSSQTASQEAASDLPVPGSTSSESTPGATDAAATPDASATPTVTPCLESNITVVPLTDKTSYGSGENPQLSIRLTNDGETDCSLNVGTSAQKFEITSGSDTWWRSTDCQSEPSDMVVMLAAGQTVESAAPLEWDRTRSSVSTCDDESRPRAPGGGATYNLTVEIGGIPSLEEAMFLLY